MAARYYAKRPFGYGGQDLHYGEVIKKFGGQRNDQKLLGLGYIGELAKDQKPCRCSRCGKEFFDALALDRHGRLTHGGGPISVEAEDKRLDDEEKFLNEIAPLGAGV